MSARTLLLLLAGGPFAYSGTTILSVPFIYEWANAGTYLTSANCGPTSVLMIASAYSRSTPMPAQINQMDDWLYAHYGGSPYYYAINNYDGSGTNTTELAALASGFFGLTSATPFSGWTLSQLQQELGNGYPVIVYVMTQMHYSGGLPHYMVLLGMDAQNVYVNDPGRLHGGSVSYPLSDFLQAWAPVVGVQAHDHAGLAIHPSSVQTSPLLGTDMPTNTYELSLGTNLPPFSVTQFLATRFSLTTPIVVSRIDLQMSGSSRGDQFTLWITNAIGPGSTAANVVFQSTLTFPVGFAKPVSALMNLPLNAGTYYIVLSSAQNYSETQGWVQASTVLPSSVGTIEDVFRFADGASANTLFPPGSDFKIVTVIVIPPLPPNPNGPAFQIFGQ